MDQPVPDQQTVEPATGERLQKRIAGVELRFAKTLPDERGSLCEIFRADWGFGPGEPVTHIYQTMIRPGRVKGWGAHEHQTDRYFVSMGSVKIVLFDDREGSPTRGLVNEFHLSNENRALLVIPPFVWHATQNTGNADALLIIFPTRAYDYVKPDKMRLPLGAEKIPYSFDVIRHGG